MRGFLVTFFALFIALLPIIGFFALYYYLEAVCESIGFSAFLSYFLIGALIGYHWKNIKSSYRDYWSLVWDAARDRLL